MPIEVKIPEVGESITEGFLAEWSKSDGDVVARDEPLLVLETDKITMTVNAEEAGQLKILVKEGETVEVGQVVATIDDTVAPSTAPTTPQPKTSEPESEPKSEPAPESEPSAPPKPADPPLSPPAGAPQAAAKLDTVRGLSPAVQRLVLEHHLDPSAIEGTGRGGRITKTDVLRFMKRSADTAPETEPTTGTLAPEQPTPILWERQTRKPMSPMRQRIAERLVEVQQQAAILTTFNEADLSGIMTLRSQYKESFKKRHGVGLGFMSFFVKASIDALKALPNVNGFIDGDQVVTNHYYDIGIAVSTEKGLVVPVIRNADRLSMAEIELAIADLATRAQERKLELSELTGAIFTISNGGVFGSMMSTPILNPPGSAILGMHAITKRPVVVEDEIVIRPMMYLAVSYDHRLIDGRESVTFLKRIVECIENPERMMLEV